MRRAGVSRCLGGSRNVDPASRVAQIAEPGGDVGERPEKDATADQGERQQLRRRPRDHAVDHAVVGPMP
jgi:hypothetical protein